MLPLYGFGMLGVDDGNIVRTLSDDEHMHTIKTRGLIGNHFSWVLGDGKDRLGEVLGDEAA